MLLISVRSFLSSSSRAFAAASSTGMALEELDKKDLTEIKSMTQPPQPVMIVCLCVVILRPLGREDEKDGWVGAKAMLGDTSFFSALQNYKRDEMKEKQVKKIRELLSKPESKEYFDNKGERMKS